MSVEAAEQNGHGRQQPSDIEEVEQRLLPGEVGVDVGHGVTKWWASRHRRRGVCWYQGNSGLRPRGDMGIGNVVCVDVE